MKYIKQLDSVRAIAVIMVVFSHWSNSAIKNIIPFGFIGVNIFFVLSGFLITGILLNKKVAFEQPSFNQSKTKIIKKIYGKEGIENISNLLSCFISFVYRSQKVPKSHSC